MWHFEDPVKEGERAEEGKRDRAEKEEQTAIDAVR